MIRPSVLLFALLMSAPALYRYVLDQVDITEVLIRFVIAVPIAALLLAGLRFVTAGYGRPEGKPEGTPVTPTPVDDGQNPVFDPWIYAADTLLPIINLGQDGYWRLDGPSQWISTALVALGWILATTAAAGAARVLKRT